MKIRKLIISAFGPYGKKQELDFAKNLDKDSMFVVTGNTGAGKTTIFDAINFALYGEASGVSRDTKSFRSNFSSAEDETFVELIFTLKGNEYKIKRNPEYRRKKKVGEGFATAKPSASLDINGGRGFENGKTITGYGNVTREVENILGINSIQFKQLVMIPQGEFKKLLEAKSQDKEEIFRKIFKTDIIKSFQENLREKANKIVKNSECLIRDRKNRINDFILKDNSELKELVQSENLNVQLILEKFSEDVEMDKTIFSEKEKLKANLDEKRQQLLKEYNEGKKINEDFDSLKSVEEKIELLIENLDNIKKKEEEKLLGEKAYEVSIKENEWIKIDLDLKNREKKLENINEDLETSLKEKESKEIVFKEEEKAFEKVKSIDFELENLKGLKEKTLGYESKEKLLKELEEELKKATYEQKIVEEEKEKNKILLEKLKDYLDKCRLESDKKILLEREKNEIINKDRVLRELISKVNSTLDIKSRHLEKGNKYNIQIGIVNEKEKEYKEAEDKLFRSQAGILAKNLEEGMECPVCGSTNHPKKAVLESIDITKEIVDELKKSFDDENKIFLELKSQIQSLKETFDENKTEVLALAKEILNLEDLEIEKVKSLGEEELIKEGENLRKVTLDIRGIDEILKKEKACIDKEKSLLKEKEEKEKKLEYLTDGINSFKVKIAKTTSEVEEIKNRFNGEIKSLEELNLREIELLKEKENIEKAFNIAKNDLDIINSKVNSLKGNLEGEKERILELKKEEEKSFKEFNDAIESFNFKDIEDYKKSKKDKNILEALDKEIITFNEELKGNKKVLEEYKKKLKNKERVDLESILEKGKSIRKEIDEKEEELRKMQSNIENNSRVIEYIKDINKKMEKDDEQYRVVGTVSKLVNGENEKKITLERYILAAYLDDILHAANKRFLKMTNDRYRLLRKTELGDKRVGQGLDLQVFDGYSNKERDITSLSGGEGFKASLSMALGLSDVVQETAGGIQLDTMFIDEGFGTLDDESLESAIDVLSELQGGGRIVGVISHVNELKERIQKKIIVNGDKDGSTAKFL